MTTQLSVIIATHNSEEFIERCMNSLKSQSHPRENFEIIVVDDGSTDKSVELVKKFGADKVIQTKPCSLAEARNIGVRNSGSENFAFLDSDCEAKDGWIKGIIRELKNVDALSGPILNGNTQSKVAWAEYFVEFGAFHEFKKRGAIRFLPGCNGACTKRAFLKSGGYTDLRASDDVLFGESLRKAGVNAYFVPDVQIFHLCRVESHKLASNMKLLGKYFVRTRNAAPLIPYASLTKSRLSIPVIFLGKIIRSAKNAYEGKKFSIFIRSFPFIIYAISSFCKGIWDELSHNKK